jgi:hypothetical protein
MDPESRGDLRREEEEDKDERESVESTGECPEVRGRRGQERKQMLKRDDKNTKQYTSYLTRKGLETNVTEKGT